MLGVPGVEVISPVVVVTDSFVASLSISPDGGSVVDVLVVKSVDSSTSADVSSLVMEEFEVWFGGPFVGSPPASCGGWSF